MKLISLFTVKNFSITILLTTKAYVNTYVFSKWLQLIKYKLVNVTYISLEIYETNRVICIEIYAL